MTFGRLSQGWTLKRAAPGERLPLGALRIGFGMGEVRPEHRMGPKLEIPYIPIFWGYIWTSTGLPSKHEPL